MSQSANSIMKLFNPSIPQIPCAGLNIPTRCSHSEERVLQCGHIKAVACGEDDDVGECSETCDAALPRCGHPCGLRCHGQSQGTYGKGGCTNLGFFGK